MHSTDAAVLLEESVASVERDRVQSLVDRLFQHLSDVRVGREQGREGTARIKKSLAVAKAVEEGVVNQTLKVRMPKCLEAPIRIVPEKRVLE